MLERFYPVEAVIIALVLAFVPYVILRGIVHRVARWRRAHPRISSGEDEPCRSQSRRNAGRFEVRVTADTHFGWLRTRLSVERTMMSWIRTAVSLIGFGFAIVQFFERLKQMPGASTTYFPEAPKYLGLSLIACGIVALFVSIWQYRWTVITCAADPSHRSPD